MEDMEEILPVDDLVRAVYPGLELKRSESAKMPTLVGYFCVFNQWVEINSMVEGHFMERFSPRCFAKTISENRARMRVLFDHGEDPSIGKKILGPITVLREEDGYYEVDLLDTSYNRDLLPGLKAGLYGSSMIFSVVKEDVVMRPKPSAYNPMGLPERTVVEARIKEFGPVPFPVYAGATSGVRSMTDQLHGRVSRTDADHDRLYKRSLDVIGNKPWAVHPSMMATMIEIISERAKGNRLSEQEIKERIGVRAASEPTADAPSEVAVINISGPIVPHASMFSEISGANSVEDLQAQLRAAIDDPGVKEILLNIDSPGGAVGLIPELGAELLAARDVKPITAVANTMAASAAYWIASQATSISVTPSGEVGSIGVITAHQDVSAMQDMMGIKTTLVTAGKYKGEQSPFQPLSQETQDHLQSEVDTFYNMFVGAVAKGRGISRTDVTENFGQGRMVLAKDAVSAGMADRVESYDQAVNRLTKKYRKGASSSASAISSTMVDDIKIIFEGEPLNLLEFFEVKLDSNSEEKVAETAPTSTEADNVDNALVESGAGNAHSSATSRVDASTNFITDRTNSEEKKKMLEPKLTIDEVKDRLANLRMRQKEIIAEFGTDPFTQEVQAEWDAMPPELDELLARIHDHEVRQETLRKYNEDEDKREREVTVTTTSSRTPAPRRNKATGVPDNIWAVEEYRNLNRTHDELGQAYRDGAMRALEGAHFSHPEANREDAQSHIGRLLDTIDDDNRSLARRVLMTGSPTYQKAFSKHIAGQGLSIEEQRSLSLTTTAGGFAVPVILDPTLILTSSGVINPIRQLARVETIVGNHWEGITSTGVTAAYSAEATEASDNAPTLAQPVADVEKAQAFIPFTIEVGEDWGALQSEMARCLQDAKDTLESNKFLTGLGHASNVPEGLLVGATAVVSSAATATFAVADVYSLETALAPRWRPRAAFVANRAQYNKVRQFDTAGGASLWVQLQVASPPTLIGYPAYEWSDMSSAASTGSSIMTIGDFSQFLILDRVGMNIELIPLMLNTGNNRPDGTRGLYCYWRNTSKVLTQLAFKTLKLL